MNLRHLSIKRESLALAITICICGQLQALNWSYIENAEVKLGDDDDVSWVGRRGDGYDGG